MRDHRLWTTRTTDDVGYGQRCRTSTDSVEQECHRVPLRRGLNADADRHGDLESKRAGRKCSGWSIIRGSGILARSRRHAPAPVPRPETSIPLDPSAERFSARSAFTRGAERHFPKIRPETSTKLAIARERIAPRRASDFGRESRGRKLRGILKAPCPNFRLSGTGSAGGIIRAMGQAFTKTEAKHWPRVCVLLPRTGTSIHVNSILAFSDHRARYSKATGGVF